MTRRRSRAPGRIRPDRRRSLPILALVLPVLVLLVVAACGGAPTGSRTPAPTRSGGVADGSPSASGEPASSDGSPSSGEPSTSDEPAPTDQPAPSEAATEAPSSTAGSGPAAACAGTDENRDFYAAVADAVDWAVYCPVLGQGWFVDTGQYRLAGGGWMEIAYKGPDGARLEFREGAACTATDCVPTGDDAGSAAFGDMDGKMLTLSGDRLAVVVDPGKTPSWTVVGSGLQQAPFETIAADLVRVGS